MGEKYSSSEPLLMLPSAATAGEKNQLAEEEINGGSEPAMVHRFYSLSSKKVVTIDKESSWEPHPDAYCVGSSYGWVALINRRPPEFDFYMANPATGLAIKLPSIQNLCIDSSDPIEPPAQFMKGKSYYLVLKAIMSSSSPNDCRVLIHYHPCEATVTRLAFCRPGDKAWTTLDSPLCNYTSIVYSPNDDMFYAMDSWFEIESWDLNDVSNPKRCPVLDIREEADREELDVFWDHVEEHEMSGPSLMENSEHFIIYGRSYLVVDPTLPSGQLFLVRRYIARDKRAFLDVEVTPPLPYKTLNFDVYKIHTNSETKTLEYVDSLGDRAVFVGLNGGFVISADQNGDERPGLKPNSIYFTDDLNCGPYLEHPAIVSPNIWLSEMKYKNYGGHDIGIYNYKDKSIEECYYPVDPRKYESIEPSPVWLTPISNS